MFLDYLNQIFPVKQCRDISSEAEKKAPFNDPGHLQVLCIPQWPLMSEKLEPNEAKHDNYACA